MLVGGHHGCGQDHSNHTLEISGNEVPPFWARSLGRPSALNSCGKGDLVCWKHVSPYVSTLILDVGGYFFGPAGLFSHESHW